MYEATHRFIELAIRLEEAGLRYGLDLDPEFAIMMSYQDARELYHDLMMSGGYEIYYFQDMTQPATRKRIDRTLGEHLSYPPHPGGKHVIWAKIEGIRIAIKGTEDE